MAAATIRRRVAWLEHERLGRAAHELRVAVGLQVARRLGGVDARVGVQPRALVDHLGLAIALDELAYAPHVAGHQTVVVAEHHHVAAGAVLERVVPVLGHRDERRRCGRSGCGRRRARRRGRRCPPRSRCPRPRSPVADRPGVGRSRSRSAGTRAGCGWAAARRRGAPSRRHPRMRPPWRTLHWFISCAMRTASPRSRPSWPRTRHTRPAESTISCCSSRAFRHRRTSAPYLERAAASSPRALHWTTRASTSRPTSPRPNG